MSDMQGALILLAVAWLISAACCWHAYRNAQQGAPVRTTGQPRVHDHAWDVREQNELLDRLDAELEADR